MRASGRIINAVMKYKNGRPLSPKKSSVSTRTSSHIGSVCNVSDKGPAVRPKFMDYSLTPVPEPVFGFDMGAGSVMDPPVRFRDITGSTQVTGSEFSQDGGKILLGEVGEVGEVGKILETDYRILDGGVSKPVCGVIAGKGHLSEGRVSLEEHPRKEEFVNRMYKFGLDRGIYDAVNEETDKDEIRASRYIDLALGTVFECDNQDILENMCYWTFTLFHYDSAIDEGSLFYEDQALLREYIDLLKYIINPPRDTTKSEINSTVESFFRYNRDHSSNESFVRARQSVDYILGMNMDNVSMDFRRQAIRYLETGQTEVKAGPTRDHTAYTDQRRISGAILTMVALAEGHLEETMPGYSDFIKRISGCDMYQTYQNAWIDYIWLINDLGSSKEWRDQSPNLIKILMLEERKGENDSVENVKLNFEGAFKYTVDLINTRLTEYDQNFYQLITNIDDGVVFTFDDTFSSLSPEDQETYKNEVKEALWLQRGLVDRLMKEGDGTLDGSRYRGRGKGVVFGVGGDSLVDAPWLTGPVMSVLGDESVVPT